jgi:hypothetical protein
MNFLTLRSLAPNKAKVGIDFGYYKKGEDVIRIRISKKNRQHNDQKKKYKRTNNDLQTPLKTGG